MIYDSHAIQAVQPNITPERNPGLNGNMDGTRILFYWLMKITADHLGGGSVQASGDPKDARQDRPFWDSLNENVKNLRAIISGHGKSLSLSYF